MNENIKKELNGSANISSTVNEKNVTVNRSKKSKKKIGTLIVVIILVLLLVFGVIYYKFILSKNVFKVLVDNSFNYLENSFVNYESASGTFSVKAKGSSNDVFDIINKIDLSGNYAIDYKNKIVDMEVKSNYDNKKLLNANIYMEDGNGYVYLEDIYDKYMKTPVDNYDNLFTNMDKQDDYKVILKSVHNAVNGALKDEYFVKENVTIDGKKVDKTTLKLTKDNYITIKKDIVNALSNDNEFLKSFSKVSEMNIDDIKEGLNDAIETNDNFDGLDISIYTKSMGLDFVKLEISDAHDKLTVKIDKDRYKYEYAEDGAVIYSGYVSASNNSDESTCIVSFNDVKNNSSIELTIKSSVNYNKEISKKDVPSSVNLSDMTDEEMATIYSNMFKTEGILGLLQDIQDSNVANGLID